ncbi:MAG: hypothetical protein JRF42_02610 [Deltaproteobacteria bacterium]|nr:hypothetical protein [Deltaproteobacteria bacterium]
MRESTTRALITAITVLAAITATSCGDAERRWSTAALLDDELGQIACGGDVAMDAHGTAVAVWCRHAANYQGSVWASRFILGEGWGPATRIDAANGGTEVWNPSLAVNAAGQAISAWSKYNGSSWGVWAARFDPSAGWDEPVLLDESGWGPGVALDNHGRATAVWTRNDDDYNGSIWTSSHEPSTGWGSTTRLDSDLIVQVGFELGPDGEEFVIAGGASQPKVAVNDNGNAVAVWLNYVSGSLWASPYLPGAGWGSPTLVGAPAWSFTPSYVAMDEAGRAIAVNLDGRASSYSPMDGWSSVTLGGGDYTTSSPNVAVAKNGQALVVWKEKREGQRIDLRASHFSTDTGWSTPETVGEADDNVHGYGDWTGSDAAINASGEILAVWHREEGEYSEELQLPRFSVWANRFEPDVGWGKPTPLSVDEIPRAFSPRLAMDEQGRGIATWQQVEGSLSNGGQRSLWWTRFE